MSAVLQQKVVSALPGVLTADTIYYVRVGTGFDLYVTNHTGTVVGYKLNAAAGPASSTARGLAVYSDTTGAVLTTAPLTVTADGALQTTGTGQSGSVAGSARGAGSVDLQSSRGGASQVASGINATLTGGVSNSAGGLQSTVTGGASNSASGANSAIGGGGNNVTSAGSSTVGGGSNNTASGLYGTVPGGLYGTASRYGQRAQAAGRFAANGDAQISSYVTRTATADATPTAMTLDGAAPSAQGRFVLNASQAIGFQGMLIATTANGAVAARWDINGLIVRGTTAASTRLVGTPTVVQSFADSGASAWAVAVSADTTNGALTFTVTGAVGISIRWVDSLLTTEVSF